MAEDKKVDFEKLRKGFEKPILKTIEIPEPKPLKFEKVKMDVPKFEDPEKKVRSTYKVSAVESFQTTKPPELESNKLVQKGTHNGVSGKWTYLPQEGGYYFQSDKKVTKKLGGKTGAPKKPEWWGENSEEVVDEREESNKLRQAFLESGEVGGTTYKQIPLEEGGGFKMVGKTRVPIEPLDTSAIPPSYLTGVPTGQTLMAGQMESNALATAGASSPSITDASSSTIVNNSNQSLMMPTPDPNPHNMDFQPEHRLFPRV
jgi:hypothetical protein